MIAIRLWHYKLIPVLPRQQLLSQWRECICIAKNLKENNTPNHLLVNKILCYPLSDFLDYCNAVLVEMVKRGYNVSASSIGKLEEWFDFTVDSDRNSKTIRPFCSWHNLAYLFQCYYNLQEKYQCGGISPKEWGRIVLKIRQYKNKWLEKER